MVHLIQSSQHHLAHRPDRLGPAEALLSALSFALAVCVAHMPSGSAIDGAAAAARDVLRHMRRDINFAARPHEAARVVSLVGPTVMRWPRTSISPSIAAAASRSAVPVALVVSTLTTSAWRLSVAMCPRKLTGC